jgi:hypothetical protein
MEAKRSWVAVAVGLVGLAVPASAGAATQIGETFPPGGSSCGVAATVLQVGSPGNQYAAPEPGVITSWSFRASGALVPTGLKLKVGRPAGGNDFTIVGESPPKNPVANSLNTYTDVRIPVQQGDVLGYFNETNGTCGRSTPGYLFRIRGGDQPPGTTLPYGIEQSNFQINFSATLEPDCDSDGFGDETQDPELSPIPACDPNAPETTITGGPKNVVKTKKKRAKVTFTFASSEPGTFECSLDGAPFTPCSSPSTHKVKAGRRKPKNHTFQVRAIDAAGNADPAPAADEFKAKRKKK